MRVNSQHVIKREVHYINIPSFKLTRNGYINWDKVANFIAATLALTSLATFTTCMLALLVHWTLTIV